MKYLSADRIFNGHGFEKQNSVLVVDETGAFMEVIEADKVKNSQIEQHKGIITPGFVNTHCHLELSHMLNMIPQKKGFFEFGKWIIGKRNSIPLEGIVEAAEKADAEMRQNGIVAVGDISNLNLTFPIKQKSKIYYHTFVELLSLNPANAQTMFQIGIGLLQELKDLSLAGSLAPHAPYSCSQELIKAIADHNSQNNAPTSIHNQESETENKFLRGEKSDFDDFYKFLQLDISWFKPKFKSALDAYVRLLNSKTNILVHNTFSSEDDLRSVKPNVFWCLCPSANLYIEDTLPNYDQLLKNTRQICFGTDSLASNSDLDLVKEASIFYSKTGELELSLMGITSIAAKALNIEERFGSFIQGNNSGVNLITTSNNQLKFEKVLC